jgi:acyl carrier protein
MASTHSDPNLLALNRLPETVRADITEFRRTRDLAVLDRIIHGAIAAQMQPPPSTPIEQFPADATLLGGVGLTSLDVIELAFLLEAALDVTISNDEMASVQTLQDLREFVRRKTGAGA